MLTFHGFKKQQNTTDPATCREYICIQPHKISLSSGDWFPTYKPSSDFVRVKHITPLYSTELREWFIMEFLLYLAKLLRTIVVKCIGKLCIGLVRLIFALFTTVNVVILKKIKIYLFLIFYLFLPNFTIFYRFLPLFFYFLRKFT